MVKYVFDRQFDRKKWEYVDETIEAHPSDPDKMRITQIFDIEKADSDARKVELEDAKSAADAFNPATKKANLNAQLAKFP